MPHKTFAIDLVRTTCAILLSVNNYSTLMPGDPAPWFVQRSFANPRYSFSTAAGRYVVLGFFGSARDDRISDAIAALKNNAGLFNDTHASFFGVSNDPRDESENRVVNQYPGYRFIWDFNGKVSKLYGSIAQDAEVGEGVTVRRQWIVLDPRLRVIKVISFATGAPHVQELLAYIAKLPAPEMSAGIKVHAPILVLPNVFEVELCRELIGIYETSGGEDSGFMREVDGKTTLLLDPRHKKRRDILLEDAVLIGSIRERFLRRIVPEISKAYQFKVTRMERHLIACYADEDGGHFAPHRDNTTKGTAHRRFAVTINLNDAFEGGELGFPEYGPDGLKPPIGCAVVFSCSLLHAVSKVRSGSDLPPGFRTTD